MHYKTNHCTGIGFKLQIAARSMNPTQGTDIPFPAILQMEAGFTPERFNFGSWHMLACKSVVGTTCAESSSVGSMKRFRSWINAKLIQSQNSV